MRALWIVFVLLGAGLAGCVDSSAVPRAADGGPAAAPAANATAASITGRVTSDEGLPVSKARVSIVESLQETQTDDSGRFTINDVVPGSYSVVVERVGFVSATRQIDALADAVAELDFVLESRTLPQQPYTVSIPSTAFIKFSWVFLQDAVSVLNQTITNQQTCDPCMFVLFVEPGFSDAATETVWVDDGLTLVNDEVWLYVKDTWTTGGFGDGTTVVGTYFTNREKVSWSDSAVKAAAKQSAVLLEVYGGFNGVNVQHRLDVWNSFSYHAEFDSSFTALPPP